MRPILECGSGAWCPFRKQDIKRLDKVKRLETKLVTAIRNKSYIDRLMLLGLTSLEERRMRGDLIEQFKIVKKLDIVDWHHPLKNLAENYNTRSHSYGFEKQLVKNCNLRFNFFTNRVANIWNKLPNDVVEQTTLNSFKNKLDKYLKTNKPIAK